MPRLGIAEILEKVSNEKNIDRRVKILHENDSPVLRGLLRLAYTPGVQWLLPEGTPPFNRNGYLDQNGNLYSQWRKFYLFFPGGNDALAKSKREMIFIQILESIDPRDADLLCAIKDGIMPYSNVNGLLVDKAWPGLIPLPQSETIETE